MKLPPGPRDGIMGFRTMAWLRDDMLVAYTQLQREFGDCVSMRVGPYRMFVFFHPDQVRELLVTRAKSFVRLPRVMQTFAQWNGNSVLIAEGADWVKQRRMVQPAFHPRRMEHYAESMVQCIQSLIASWEPAIFRQGFIEVDTDEAMVQLTLQVIGKTLFDTDIGRDSTHQIGKAVAILSEIAFHEMQAFIRWPDWIPTHFHRRKRWAIQELDSFVWELVRTRRASGVDHGDLLSMLLSAVDDQDPNSGLTDRQVRDEAMTLLLAGHDSSAAALDWLWYNLTQNPDVLQRCQQEIDDVLKGRLPTASDASKLAYVQATVKESLRLYPPAVGVFLRQATENLMLGGYDIPRGSLVVLSSFVTQRDARWFVDPLRFEPDRFLGARAESIPQGAYFPFGAGPRVCIGQAFAMSELVLVAACFLQKYSVQFPLGQMPPVPHVHVALRPSAKLVTRWVPRSVSAVARK